AAQVLARALGQGVRRALEPPEPAVDVALENARGVRHQTRLAERLQAGPAAALDEHGAAERLLAIRGDDRRARDAPATRIADPARVLAEQAGQVGLLPARPVGNWIHDDLDAGRRASRRDGHETETEPATQVAHVAPEHRAPPAAAAARTPHREI